MPGLFKGKTSYDNIFKTIFMALFIYVLLLIASVFLYAITGLRSRDVYLAVLIPGFPLCIMLLIIWRLRVKYLKRIDGKQAKSLLITGLVLISFYILLEAWLVWRSIAPGDERQHQMLDSNRMHIEHMMQQMNLESVTLKDSSNIKATSAYLNDSVQVWTKLLDSAGRFELRMPGRLGILETDTIYLSGNIVSSGKSIIQYFQCDKNTDISRNIYSFNAFKVSELSAKGVESNFRVMIEDIVQSAGALLVFSNLYLQEENGSWISEFRLHPTINGVIISGKQVYYEGIVYQLLVLSKEPCESNTSIKHYFESLKIVF
jgi:hypothetical protein